MLLACLVRIYSLCPHLLNLQFKNVALENINSRLSSELEEHLHIRDRVCFMMLSCAASLWPSSLVDGPLTLYFWP